MFVLPTLARLPIVFCAVLANSIAFTQPGPPPKKNEYMRHTSTWEQAFNVVVPHLTKYMKNAGWLIFAGEVTAILASHHPSFPPCRHTLRLLAHLGLSPSPNIGITSSLLLGTFFATVGAIIRSYCYRALGHFFTFQLSLRRAQGQRLCTSGPYAIVRHPSYTGLIMVIAAFSSWAAGPGSWLRESQWLTTPVGQAWFWAQNIANVYAVGSLLLRTGVEDKALRAEFEKDWVDWVENVPYKILPRVY